jgi:GTPase
MKHQHEIDSGRTSCVSNHLIGYKEGGDCDGRPIPIQTLKNVTAAPSSNNSTTKIQLKSEDDN